MTNGEKYKTAKERAEAFFNFIDEHNAIATASRAFAWLDLEAAAEEPLPCPFCGSKVQVMRDTQAIAEKARWLVNCYGCNYEYGADTKETLITAHNRVARAVAKEKEAN